MLDYQEYLPNLPQSPDSDRPKYSFPGNLSGTPDSLSSTAIHPF